MRSYFKVWLAFPNGQPTFYGTDPGDDPTKQGPLYVSILNKADFLLTLNEIGALSYEWQNSATGTLAEDPAHMYDFFALNFYANHPKN